MCCPQAGRWLCPDLITHHAENWVCVWGAGGVMTDATGQFCRTQLPGLRPCSAPARRMRAPTRESVTA